MYYFIRWKHTRHGYAPDIPEETGFLMLAEPGRASDGAEFALFRCDLPDGYEKSKGITEVSDELGDLLRSAEDYPPALALTREDLERDESRTTIEFSKKLTERLAYYLQEQAHFPFFMAKAKKTEPGYKYAGGYYWIVGSKDESVLWVSRDYIVYDAPLDDFEVDASEIKLKFHCLTQRMSRPHQRSAPYPRRMLLPPTRPRRRRR
jgi:hypothetical protein